MTGSKVDPRVVKTRSSLRKALVYLMKHEKLENISVQKITETANITRGTFYLHYKDKRDFIKSAIMRSWMICLHKLWLSARSQRLATQFRCCL